MSASFLYSDCSCCRNAESARLQRHPGEQSPETVADCLALLSQESPAVAGSLSVWRIEGGKGAKTDDAAPPVTYNWNDATRGAYRAQRRKDEAA